MVNYKRNTAAKHSAGRSPIKKFPFATMLPYAVQYVQFLQQKQKTGIYTRKAPRHPGLPLTVPYSRQKYKQWKKQANQFAQYYLTAYHPEVEVYAAGDMTVNPDHEKLIELVFPTPLTGKHCKISLTLSMQQFSNRQVLPYVDEAQNGQHVDIHQSQADADQL